MTINLPDDLERFLQAEVHEGRFASEDDAVAEALRLLRHQLHLTAKAPTTSDSLLGIMRDATEEMDEIAAEAMRRREQQVWRLSPHE